jgi:hypothetical protein
MAARQRGRGFGVGVLAPPTGLGPLAAGTGLEIERPELVRAEHNLGFARLRQDSPEYVRFAARAVSLAPRHVGFEPCRTGARNAMALEYRISQGAVVSAEESPVEREDRWILNLRGMSVIKISVDFRLVLVLDSDWEVALEAPVYLSHGAVHANPSVLLKPESQDVAAALVLFGAKVLSAVAFKSGTLRLVFDTGHHLACSSGPAFEGWQVTGPAGWRFASLPGGGLAVRDGS